MEELSEEKRQEIQDVFSVIDENKDGSIDITELGKGLRCLGLNPTLAELKGLIEEFDTNNNQVLDLSEFANLFNKYLTGERTQEEELKEQFKKLDINGDGFIDATELRKVLLYGEEKLTEEEADNIISEFDTNGDGKLSLEEFIKGVFVMAEEED